MIVVGQDALGAWAWMLKGENGDLIQSGQGYAYMEDAIAEAFDAFVEARDSGDARVTPAQLRLVFPDGEVTDEEASRLPD